jgi:hypothetical protein
MTEGIWQVFLAGAFLFTSSMVCLAGMQSESYRIPTSVQSGGGH